MIKLTDLRLAHPSSRHQRDERGAFLILWALLIAALLTMVAIVVDLGQVRASHRQNQSIADLAATAAGPSVAPDLSGARNIVQACRDAFTYIKLNAPGFPSGSPLAINMNTQCLGLPACPDAGGGVPSGTDAQAIFGTYTITIRYPIAASEITDTNFTSGVGKNDGTDPCERLRVTVRRASPSFFAGILGVTPPTARGTAVIRGFPLFLKTQIPALLLLERQNCSVLQTSGGSSGLEVKALLPQPGIIHADSTGSNLLCSNTTTPSGYVVYGGKTGPSVKADGFGLGTLRVLGRIDLYAVTVGSLHTEYFPPLGVTPGATPGKIASRISTDLRYNSNSSKSRNPHTCSFAVSGATGTCINALRSDSNFYFGKPASYFSLHNWLTISGSLCTADLKITLTSTQPGIYVNCPTGLTPNGSHKIVFTGVPAVSGAFPSKLVLTGPLTTKNSVRFNNFGAIYIAGTGLATGNSDGVSVPGAWCINAIGLATPLTDCPVAVPLPLQPLLKKCSSSTTLTFAAIVVKTGDINIASGSGLHACNAFFYAGTTLASPQQTIAPNVSPTFCNSSLPCPLSTGTNGVLLLHGGVEWTSPRAHPGVDPDLTSPWEGLLFWSESGTNLATSNDDVLDGQSSMTTSGVLFTPNAGVTFHGNGSNAQVAAQFICARLNLNGTSRLLLAPDPLESVPIQAPSWGLIR